MHTKPDKIIMSIQKFEQELFIRAPGEQPSKVRFVPYRYSCKFELVLIQVQNCSTIIVRLDNLMLSEIPNFHIKPEVTGQGRFSKKHNEQKTMKHDGRTFKLMKTRKKITIKVKLKINNKI